MAAPVAIVTGGSSNIGWAIVRRLAATHDVFIGDVAPPKEELPARCRYVACDVTDSGQVASLVAECSAQGPLRTVVHSAAITQPAVPVVDLPLADWERVIRVNLTGAFIVCKHAAAAMQRPGGGIVLVSSRAGRTGVAALNVANAGAKAHYCASKAGVISLAKSLATELASDGVRVNAVAPGSIEGTMIPRERWDAIARQVPLGRLGTAEEVAGAVAFLCSDDARYITGHVLDVNGGTLMH
jgi:NAD(P)-dependent dehydrogenase (short-subunit alcohol dehydrogenase family)